MVAVHRPATLEEALAIRAASGAVPFAGGTDLMVRFRRGAGALPAIPGPVLLLDRCAELARIDAREDRLTIGAAVTLSSLAGSTAVPPLLRDIALSMGGPAVRSAATLGGNVCNASPAGDTLPFLYAMDARAVLGSLRGTRELSVEEFIAGPGATRLRPDELLLGVFFPLPAPPLSYWRKVGTRRANALTKVSVAAVAEGGGGGTGLHGVRIALGAVAPTVVRLREVESYLEGKQGAAEPDDAARIRAMAAAAVRPIDDQRSTAAYRRRVAENLVLEAVRRLAGPRPEARPAQWAPDMRGPST